MATQQQQQQHQSPPNTSMSSLEALIQAAQFLEESESEFCFVSPGGGGEAAECA